jgi:hypothetical protein
MRSFLVHLSRPCNHNNRHSPNRLELFFFHRDSEILKCAHRNDVLQPANKEKVRNINNEIVSESVQRYRKKINIPK